MPNLSASTKLFIGLVGLAGLGAMFNAMLRWESTDLVRFFAFLVVTALASRLKVSLPGLNGSMSVNVPFLLIAVAELSLGEAVVIAAISILVQCLPSSGKRMHPVQVLFNISTMVLAVSAAALAFARGASMPNLAEKSLLTAIAGGAYLLANTLPVAAVIALSEGRNMAKIWKEIFDLTFPYFALSVAVAALSVATTHLAGWQAAMLVAPVMAQVYRSYKRYFAPLMAPRQFHTAAAAD